jgi:hypothetical protein
MPRWYYKPAIIGLLSFCLRAAPPADAEQISGFELQERGSSCEPKVYMEENLTGSKHHVIIRRQREKALDRPDVAGFPNPILSDPHAIIEFTRDGRVCSQRFTLRTH